MTSWGPTTVRCKVPWVLPPEKWGRLLSSTDPPPDTLDLRHQLFVTSSPRRSQCGVAPLSCVTTVPRRGNPQHFADRLNPVRCRGARQ